MKKLLYLLFLAPSMAFAVGAGGINLSPRPTSGSGGGSGVITSTRTIDISIAGGAYLSTNTLYGIPGGSRTPGYSTWTILNSWTDCARGSTVGVVGIRIAQSTGGWNPQYSYLLQDMHVSTVGANGIQAISPYFSSRTIINAFNWIGVQLTTMPTSGLNAQDCWCHIRVKEQNEYLP